MTALRRGPLPHRLSVRATDRGSRVAPGPLADRIHSVDDGLRLVWQQPEIADRFARIWEQPPADA